MKTTPLSDSLRLICRDLFLYEAYPENFPTEFWLKTYPIDVVLYALRLEADRKYRRTPTMTPAQIVNFADSVMDRKLLQMGVIPV